MIGSGKELVIVLAGGEGRRLLPLTRERAKPAVPFAGHYRLIDFVLSNLVNGGFRRIVVLTQYKSHSLDRHLATTWRLSPLLGNYVAPVPAQMRTGRRWFSGSADAIYQNLNLIRDERPAHVLVFGADHIYRMDPRQMLLEHIDSQAGVTVSAIPVPMEEAGSFGIIDSDGDGRIRRFVEKPAQCISMPGDASRALASMGNYVFTTDVLLEAVRQDAELTASGHDLGGDVILNLVERGLARVYDFSQNDIPGQTARERGYWRDVGGLDAYYQASMDLVSAEPVFDLYNLEWPFFSGQTPLPPAKFVHDRAERRGMALDSLVSNGAVVSGGTVRESILSPQVRVRSHALVEQAVLLEGVDVGRGAIVRRAIVDKGVRIPEGFQIGVDPEADLCRFKVSDNGVVVIGKKDPLA